jgi:hypothetical protein
MKLRILLFCAYAWLFASCGEDESQPVIREFSPRQATIGSVVVLEGKDFPDYKKINVQVNGVDAEVLAVWKDRLQFRVPAGATSGKISVSGNGSFETEESLQIDAPEGTWGKKADFPGVWRHGAVTFSSEGLGYVGLGNYSSSLKDFWKYDPATDVWTRLADADFEIPVTVDPNDYINAVGSFVKEGVAYILFNSYGVSNYLFMATYDIAQDKWESFPFPLEGPNLYFYEKVGAQTFGDKGVLGFTHNKQLPVYDVEAGQWSSSDIYPGGDGIRLRSFLGSKAYFIETPHNANVTLWEYDIAADAWQQKDASTYPWIINYRTIQFNLNASVYFGMGEATTSSPYPDEPQGKTKFSPYSLEIGDMWKYTPATNTWKAIPPCPYKRYDPVVFTIDNKAYFVFGNGYDDDWQGLSTVVYTP